MNEAVSGMMLRFPARGLRDRSELERKNPAAPREFPRAARRTLTPRVFFFEI